MMVKKLLVSILFISLLVVSCKKDNSTCDDAAVTYNGQIKTIFSGCTASGCHNSGSVSGSLANYTDSKSFPLMSRMLGALRGTAGFSAMPQEGTKLSDCDISKVEKWINSGFPE